MTVRIAEMLSHLDYERTILFPTIYALRKRGESVLSIIRFIVLRVISSRGYAACTLYRTPEGVPVNNRYDLLVYRELFLLDDYRADYWGPSLRAEQAPLVYDVGANVGMFSALCLTLNPGARVRCFEMIPECKSVIRDRLNRMGKGDVVVEIAAVGMHDDESITVSYHSPFAPGNHLENQDGNEKCQVSAISLDGYSKRSCSGEKPFLVKIDVEGAEAEVVNGGIHVLKEAQYILMEIHGPKLREQADEWFPSHRLIMDISKPGGLWVCIWARISREMT